MNRTMHTPQSRRPNLQGNLPALGTALLALTAASCSSGGDDNVGDPGDGAEVVGGIFALTNRHNNADQLRNEGQDPLTETEAGNEVVAYRRFDNGALELVGSFPTGEDLIGENIRNSGANPLASQDPLIVSEDGNFLFAVNAGSDSVTSMSIDGETMELTVMSTISTAGVSGMQNPVSLTQHGDVLYVLNSGTFFDLDAITPLDFVPTTIPDPAGGPDDTLPDPRRLRRASGIIGFTIDEFGNLGDLPSSELTLNDFPGFAGDGPNGPGNMSLGANGGSIDFNAAGDALYITERRTNNIVTLELTPGMVPSGVGTNLDSSTDQPFGTDVVTTLGGTEVLLVSQGNNGLEGLSTLSSFTIGAGGALTGASLSDGTETDPFITGFTFGCWVESFIGADGDTYAYTANTPDGTLTGYLVDDTSGELTRLESPTPGEDFPNIPATGNTNGIGVLDTEIAGGFLYQVVNVGGADASNNSRISVFQVMDGGALSPLTAFDTENSLFVPRQFVGIAGF